MGAIKSSFGTIFPVIFFVALALFILNVFNRLLVLMKLEQFQFGAGENRTEFPSAYCMLIVVFIANL